MSWLPALLAILAIGAILFTTPAGRRLRARLRNLGGAAARGTAGGGGGGRGRATREDHDFLLRVCGGDEDRLSRRLEVEIRRNPHLSEAQLYRRAIRTYMRGRSEQE
ncbi:MAG: hypothetical protein O7A09_07405 [Proteobacteria bacterium]|nr:hypothetical protein [Pseudomonadota bacterium]